MTSFEIKLEEQKNHTFIIWVIQSVYIMLWTQEMKKNELKKKHTTNKRRKYLYSEFSSVEHTVMTKLNTIKNKKKKLFFYFSMTTMSILSELYRFMTSVICLVLYTLNNDIFITASGLFSMHSVGLLADL